MDGDGKDTVGSVERFLDPVPVMGIDVKIKDPAARIGLPGHCDGEIVQVTKARSPGAVGVMEPSPRMEGHVRPPLRNLFERQQAASGHDPAPVPHTWKNGVISKPEAPIKSAGEMLPGVGPSESFDIRVGVDPRKLLFPSSFRLEKPDSLTFEKTISTHEDMGQIQPGGPKRMAGSVTEGPVKRRINQKAVHE